MGITNHWTTNHWTGLDWTGILKFVFMRCCMQLLQIIILTSSNFRVPGMHSNCSTGDQLCSYISEKAMAFCMATRMMPVLLLGMNIAWNLWNSLCTNLANETKSQKCLAAVDALFAAVWVNCQSRPNNPAAIYLASQALLPLRMQWVQC